MIQVNRIYLIFNRLVTKKFLVDTSEEKIKLSLYMMHKPMCVIMKSKWRRELVNNNGNPGSGKK